MLCLRVVVNWTLLYHRLNSMATQEVNTGRSHMNICEFLQKKKSQRKKLRFQQTDLKINKFSTTSNFIWWFKNRNDARRRWRNERCKLLRQLSLNRGIYCKRLFRAREKKTSLKKKKSISKNKTGDYWHFNCIFYR